MKKLTFLVISLMTSASANGQTNSIYIDQVGDESIITLTQEGEGNKIGDSENTRFFLEGNVQTVTVKQDGNNNVINGSVLNAANIDYDTTVTGDNNEITYDQGASGSVAGSTKTLTVTGDSNDLTFNQGTVSSATDATQTISITGDTNTLTSTINTDDVVNTKTIVGSGNVITTVQNGLAGKNIDMLLTGSTNNITVNQTSTENVDTIKIDSTSNDSILIINQCNTSPC
jgi:hypothetical protein